MFYSHFSKIVLSVNVFVSFFSRGVKQHAEKVNQTGKAEERGPHSPFLLSIHGREYMEYILFDLDRWQYLFEDAIVGIIIGGTENSELNGLEVFSELLHFPFHGLCNHFWRI